MLYAIPGLMPPRRKNAEARLRADREGRLKISLGLIQSDGVIPAVRIYVRDLDGKNRYFDRHNTDIYTGDPTNGFQEIFAILPAGTILDTPCKVLVIVGNQPVRTYISERDQDSMVGLESLNPVAESIAQPAEEASARTLYFIAGDTNAFDAVIKVDGVPMPLTGAKLWFTAKYAATDPDESAVFQKTELDGISIVDSTGGKITVTVAPADTNGLATGTSLVYDLVLHTALGEVFTVDLGNIYIQSAVTHNN